MIEELLFTIAEIAVALIGFSGVVTVLGHRGQGNWQAAEKVRLQAMVEPSIIALFGALSPATLGLILESGDSLWRLSNALVLAMHLVGFTAYTLRARHAETLLSQKLMASLAVLVFLVQASSLFNLMPYHQFALVLGLLLGLMVAVFNFCLLLFHIIHAGDEAS